MRPEEQALKTSSSGLGYRRAHTALELQPRPAAGADAEIPKAAIPPQSLTSPLGNTAVDRPPQGLAPTTQTLEHGLRRDQAPAPGQAGASRASCTSRPPRPVPQPPSEPPRAPFTTTTGLVADNNSTRPFPSLHDHPRPLPRTNRTAGVLNPTTTTTSRAGTLLPADTASGPTTETFPSPPALILGRRIPPPRRTSRHRRPRDTKPASAPAPRESRGPRAHGRHPGAGAGAAPGEEAHGGPGM